MGFGGGARENAASAVCTMPCFGTAAMTETPVPPGFEPAFPATERFIGLCGPLYIRRRTDAAAVLALRIEPKHLNLLGIAHGGLLVTLADSALGYTLHHAHKARVALVTVTLSTDFIAPARLGDWVEAYVDVQHVGSRMAFANCTLHVGERRILRASGVFAVFRKADENAQVDG